MFNLYCIAAGVLGAFLGYFFAYTNRGQTAPSATEFSTLFSTVLGGTVLTLLGQLQCAEVLPIYVIGVVAGYAIYLGLVAIHWNAIAGSMEEGSLDRPPLFPWGIPPRPRHGPSKKEKVSSQSHVDSKQQDGDSKKTSDSKEPNKSPQGGEPDATKKS